MKRQPILNFFDISSDVEELPKNELFKLKGGYSDVGWWEEIDPVDVYPPGGGGEDPWGGDNGGGDDDWYYGDGDNDYDEDYWNNIPDGGGGGSTGGGNNGENNSNTGQQDPFKRDSNGNLIVVSTGISTSNSDYGVTLIMDQVKIQLTNGQEVIAYKVGMVYDPATQESRLPTDAEKANCFGQALLGGEYWFGVDDPNTSNVNEGTELEKILGLYFEETTKDEASLAIVDHGGPYHAGIVNEDGTYTAKGGTGEEHTYGNEAAFRDGPNGEGTYTDGEIKYYKPKN